MCGTSTGSGPPRPGRARCRPAPPAGGTAGNPEPDHRPARGRLPTRGTVTRRVLLTVVAVCALGVAVFFVPMALLAREQHRQSDLLEMQRLAAAAVRSVPPDLRDAARRRPLDTKSHQSYALYDAVGRRLVGRGPDQADPAADPRLRGTVASGRHRHRDRRRNRAGRRHPGDGSGPGGRAGAAEHRADRGLARVDVRPRPGRGFARCPGRVVAAAALARPGHRPGAAAERLGQGTSP